MRTIHVFKTLSNRFRPLDLAKSRGRWILAGAAGVTGFVALLSVGLLILNPGDGQGPLALLHHHDHESDIEYWTCSMHPQVHEKGPGQCPICHMDLIPVKKKQAAIPKGNDQAALTPGDKGLVEVGYERQQMIGLRTAVAEEVALHSRIQTTGRVAFDPELAVAIREYLTIAGDPNLQQYAVTRLKMLGMGDEEIRTLPSRRREYESLYLQKGDTTWVYAALYQNDLPFVHPGMKAKIRLPSGGDSSKEWDGIVRSVSPTVDAKTRNLQARIEIRHGADLKPDMYVNVSILSSAGRGLVVPRDAIVDTGNEQLVYVVTDKTRFSPRRVRAGAEVDEGTVITDGLKPGETVVSSATFLIDSESRLRGGM